MSLNMNFIARTIKALESGAYTHWSSSLRSFDATRHCCLGVMCELSKEFPELPQLEWKNGCFGEISGVLDPKLRHAIGLTNAEMSHLYDLNDTHLDRNNKGSYAAPIARLKELLAGAPQRS